MAEGKNSKEEASLSNIKLKAYLNLLTTNDKFTQAIMVFLGSLGVFTAVHFYPLFIAIFLSLVSGYIAYSSKPEYGVLFFTLIAVPAFSYQSTVFFWVYLIPLSLLLFNVWKYWDMVTHFQLIVFLPFSPFPISLLGGFVYLVLIISALYSGSKRSIALAAISVYMIMLLSVLWGVENTAYFPISNHYETHESLMRQEPIDFEHFPDAFSVSMANALDFSKALQFGNVMAVISDNTLKLLFEDTLFLQILIWAFVLFIAAIIPGYVRSKYAETASSLSLLLIIPGYYLVYMFNQAGAAYPIAIPIYVVLSLAMMFLLEKQGFRFSRELEIRKKKDEKSFSKFGLQELTLSKGETGLKDLGGYEDVKKELKESITLPLEKPDIAYAYGLKPPKGILLFGPPGTGKTMVMRALAKEIDYPFFYVKTSELLSSLYGESEKNVSEIFDIARKKSPCILFFDEIDAIAKKRSASNDEVTPRVLSQLLQEIDGFKDEKKIIFIASTNVPDLLDPALLRPGRTDKVIYMRLPEKSEREEIFKVCLKDLPCDSKIDFAELGEKTERCSGADIKNIVNEAKAIAANRAKATLKISPINMKDFKDVLARIKPSTSVSDIEKYESFKIDFERKIMEKPSEKPEISFKDVGNLERVKSALKESMEIPLTHPELLKKYKLTPPNGILLFGPPGTGKTYIARAAAGEFNAPIYLLSGATLLQKGASQAASVLKETFNQARDNSPCIIFIDEIDKMFSAKQGIESLTGQLLTELDGIKELESVLVMGATNQPGALDPAFLRPGRFDKIIYLALPEKHSREEIFKIHMQEFAEGFDADAIAEATDGYSSADIADLCKTAKYEMLKAEMTKSKSGFSTKDLLALIKERRPSTTKQMLEVYRKFLEHYGERK